MALKALKERSGLAEPFTLSIHAQWMVVVKRLFGHAALKASDAAFGSCRAGELGIRELDS